MASQTIDVTTPDGQRLHIENVPEDLTVSTLLSKLASLPMFAEVAHDLSLRANGKTLLGSDFITDNPVEIIIVHQDPNPCKSILFLLLLAAIHAAAVLLAIKRDIWCGITCYSLSVLVFGLLCMKFDPGPNLVKDALAFRLPKGPVYDAVFLFILSLLPSFRLEDALVHD
jgi:hypothetical protein